MTEQWVAKKLEVLVEVPEQIDLGWLRGSGPQPDEQLQPEESAAPQQPAGLSTAAAGAVTMLPCPVLRHLISPCALSLVSQHCVTSVPLGLHSVVTVLNISSTIAS